MPTLNAQHRLSPVLLILLSWLTPAFIVPPLHAQSGFLEGSVAYPLSESNVTFSELYDGEMHVGLSYTHVLRRHFRLGVSTEFARFRNAGVYDVHMTFLMPSVLAVYGTHFSGRHRFEATLRGGAAYIFHRSDAPGFVSLDESGPYVSPGIRFVFQATPVVKAQMGIGYKVIFERFGDGATQEDSTIRYLVFGTGIMVGI